MQQPQLINGETVLGTFEVKRASGAQDRLLITTRRIVATDMTKREAPILSIPLRAITTVSYAESGGMAKTSSIGITISGRDFEWTCYERDTAQRAALLILAHL